MMPIGPIRLKSNLENISVPVISFSFNKTKLFDMNFQCLGYKSETSSQNAIVIKSRPIITLTSKCIKVQAQHITVYK